MKTYLLTEFPSRINRYVALRVLLFVIIMFQSAVYSLLFANTWTIYAAYGNDVKATKIGSKIYVLSDGGLYRLDNQDNSVSTFDKTNELSDYGISDIGSCGSVLVVVYKNGNIDLLVNDKLKYNISDFKNKELSDKTVQHMGVFGHEVFISTNSGIVVLNVKNANFTNYYSLKSASGSKETDVSCTILRNDTIFALANNGKNVFVGDRKKNLLDYSNWEIKDVSAFSFDDYIAKENQENTNLLDIVHKYLKNNPPSGPKRNYFYNMKYEGNRLLVAGGFANYGSPKLDRPGTIMYYENDKWFSFDETLPLEQVNKGYYSNITNVVQDPSRSNHHFASAFCSGLYEFEDGKLVKHYSYDNSPLTSILPNDKNGGYYVRITGLNFDKNKNLWMLNNQCDTIVRIRTASGAWKSYYCPEVAGYPTFDHVVFDKRGWAWINSRRSTGNGSKAGLLVIDTGGSIDQKKMKYNFISSLINQDGKSYTEKMTLMNCMVEDLNGAIWVGTNMGPFVIENPEKAFDRNKEFVYTQPKVARNDGTNFADYLLNEVGVKCIVVDGANRKWIGTSSNGLYLVNADGSEILQHFTTENSPLISNEINTLAIEGTKGEIMIGTNEGLCSYISDYSDPFDTFVEDNIKVYPNPVTPEYSGLIQITGFELDSYVKIASANGRLVKEGRSVGGKFTWDGRLNDGRPAESGIYFILASNGEGNEHVASKFLIVR